jgi:CelD/BcsL family acetyltransferase involved in cellulose biosynthesis
VLRRDGSVGLIGERLFDYRDVLHAGDEAVLRRAWSELSPLGRAFTSTALRGEECSRQWRGARILPFANAPCVRLADLVSGTPGHVNAAAAREQFVSGQRRLARHARGLARQGTVLRRHAGGQSELLRWLYEAKGGQPMAGENLFAEPSRREFMARIASDPEARCEVFTCEAGTEIVAALVTFRDEAWRHFYTTYFDPRWADSSPGQILLFEATVLSLGEGLNCDYLTGEYPYKNRLATAQVALFTVHVPAAEMASVFCRHEPVGSRSVA